MPDWVKRTKWALVATNIVMAVICMAFAFAISLMFKDKLNELQHFWHGFPLGGDGLTIDLGLPFRDFRAMLWAIITMLFLASVLNILETVLLCFAVTSKRHDPRLLAAIPHTKWGMAVALGDCAAVSGLCYVMTLAIWQLQQSGGIGSDWHQWWQVFLAIFSLLLFDMVVLVGGGSLVLYDCKVEKKERRDTSENGDY